MGKVYVIRKQESNSMLSNASMAYSPSSGAQLMVGTSPENVDYSQYGTSNSNQRQLAQRYGNLGRYARYGMAGLGALNSFYNTTASGQPGAISSLGSGALSGYYGSQGLENIGAKFGGRVGVRRDARESNEAYDEAKRENERRMVNVIDANNRVTEALPNIASPKQPPPTLTPTNSTQQSLLDNYGKQRNNAFKIQDLRG
jgi:hypothetical protein